MSIQEILGERLAVPVAEAARLLGLGESTLYRAIELGHVPNAGLPGSKRIPAWFLIQKLAPPAN